MCISRSVVTETSVSKSPAAKKNSKIFCDIVSSTRAYLNMLKGHSTFPMYLLRTERVVLLYVQPCSGQHSQCSHCHSPWAFNVLLMILPLITITENIRHTIFTLMASEFFASTWRHSRDKCSLRWPWRSPLANVPSRTFCPPSPFANIPSRTFCPPSPFANIPSRTFCPPSPFANVLSPVGRRPLRTFRPRVCSVPRRPSRTFSRDCGEF